MASNISIFLLFLLLLFLSIAVHCDDSGDDGKSLEGNSVLDSALHHLKHTTLVEPSLKNDSTSASTSACPEKCRCWAEGRRIECSGVGLTRPPKIPLRANVEHLDLRGNSIRRIGIEDFEGFTNLDTLILSQNQIRHIDEGLLDSLPRLQRLYLVRNQIRHLPKLAVTGPSILKVLDLHSNQLHSIPAEAFDNLSELSRLNLAGNFLQQLPQEFFFEKPALKAVNLRFNPWNCDCRIRPLLDFLSANPELEKSYASHHHHLHQGTPLRNHLNQHYGAQSSISSATCQNPGGFRGISLNRLDPEAVSCFRLKVESTDEIQIGSENDKRLTLSCDVWRQDHPPRIQPSSQTIEWIYKNETINQSIAGERELMDDGSLVIYGNSWALDQLECAVNYFISATRQSRHTHSGAHQDQQRTALVQQRQQRQFPHQRHHLSQQQQHREGSTSTAQQRRPSGDVYEQHRQRLAASYPSHSAPPQFTYTIRDRLYREGSAVQLNCEVIGEPRPQIRWRLNNTAIEPSRKYEIKKDGTQLTIYPFLEHDIGRYSCVAENIHGRIESTPAFLDLKRSDPPVIIEGPQGLTARLGQRVVFRCRARGEPQPKITWFFDGSEIQYYGNHYQVSDDGEELTITAIGRQDAGIVSCMAGNSVGSMTADAQLRIQASQLDAIDRRLSDEKLRSIVEEASQNVDRAISKTKEEFRSGVNSPHELLRHFKFAIKQPTELTRAREIYEESLRLIEKHVELGLRLNPTDMPTNVSYESVLSVTHIQTMMELSGCMNGQFKDACTDMCFHSKYRSYTGQCNNFEHPTWGVSQMPFLRLLPPIYENGFNTPVGWDPDRLYNGFRKPNPRTVSRELIGTEEITPHKMYSSMLMQWGQFLDHDLDFIATALSRQTYMEGAHCNKTCENISPCFNIPLPADDPRRTQTERDPNKRMPCIEFERSAAICGSGETSPIFKQVTYREQANIITSFIDASNVYGSTEVDALDLRDLFSDHGLLRFDIVSSAQKPYLPFERDSAMDCRRNFSVDNPIRCFLAGDFRANEQLGLTAMHTIWLREHNRIATKLLSINPNWDGERIYQETRKIVGAMMQHITYSQWLPKVLGKEGFDALIGPYQGYDPEVNPSISNAFATSAFRFGHTLINPKLERLDNNFEPISVGAIPLHEAFFAPERLLAEGGIDPILRGLFATPLKLPMTSQLLNTELIERLFHRAHNVSLDLAAMNIQRGRDHGIPGYVEYRRFCNLTVPETWDELARDVKDEMVLAKLRRFYGHPANIDLWVGGIVEKRLPDALVGPTFSCIIGDQFKRLRAGDRFWYENPGVFTPLQLNALRKTSLAKVLCNNGDEIERIQPDVFAFVGKQKLSYRKCAELPDVSLKMWMHCCDETCSAPERESSTEDGSSKSSASRRRRTLHLYSSRPGEDPQKEKQLTLDSVSSSDKSCKTKGKLRGHGEHWEIKCDECKCEDGIVWCHTLENCSAEEDELG